MKKYFLLIPHLLLATYQTDLHFEAGSQEAFSVDHRQALYTTDESIVYGNLKAAVASTNGTYTPHTRDPFIEGNMGLGYRQFFENRGMGAYAFYGRLKTPYHNYFSRATFGVEYMRELLSGFANIYLPIGSQSRSLHHYHFKTFDFRLFEHKVQFNRYRHQEVLSPFAVELGIARVFDRNKAVIRAHYHAKTHASKLRTGLSFELIGRWTSHLLSNVTVGYDSFYRGIAQVGVQYTWGDVDNQDVCTGFNPLERVYLEEFFWAKRNRKKSATIVKDNIFYVDSSRVYSNGFSGDGTFENPFVNAALANSTIPGFADATVYFYQGAGPYQNFGTFNLIGTQMLTGQGGNWVFDGVTLLPGSSAQRPVLARTVPQQTLNTPLINLTDGASNVVGNIALTNISGLVATGGSMIVNSGPSIGSFLLQNVVTSDKVTLFLTGGTSSIQLFGSDIYGVDIKAFNASSLELQVQNNTFRTNTMVAQRFFQPIGASLFMESLNSSNYIVSNIQGNTCVNTTLNGNAHLGFGFLASSTSLLTASHGFHNNTSLQPLPASNAGAFLFQGTGPVTTGRVYIEGCTGNVSDPLVSGFTLQGCNVNIKSVGFPTNTTGLSQANLNTAVFPFASVVITNTP